MHNPAYWIKQLRLQQHIEGGWYSEVYRSSQLVHARSLPTDRAAATHIYFLLQEGEFSAFHRIRADEIWHFYQGDPLIITELQPDGTLIDHLLGNEPEKGEQLCCVIKAGNWFGSRVKEGGSYGLAGCTVAPGFDFADLELAQRDQLLAEYPQHAMIIRSLTHSSS